MKPQYDCNANPIRTKNAVEFTAVVIKNKKATPERFIFSFEDYKLYDAAGVNITKKDLSKVKYKNIKIALILLGYIKNIL